MKKILSLLLVFTLIFSLTTSVFAAADTPNNDKAKMKSDVEKLLAKYDFKLLNNKEIKALEQDGVKFKGEEKNIDLDQLEQYLIAVREEMQDVAVTDYSGVLQEISPSLVAPSLMTTSATASTISTITTTLYKNSTIPYSNPLYVRYQVPVTYTKQIIVVPGEPDQVIKNLISWSQGEVVQTGGTPYQRLTSYYSGVTKVNNTTLNQTGGFTSDSYVGISINGFEVLKFTGTASITFNTNHSI